MEKFFRKQSTLGLALALSTVVILTLQPWDIVAQAPQPATGVKYSQIGQDDMKQWLTYLSSDELQGRQIFTEGYGLAAQYIADHLRQWGVKSINPDGSYFQPVKLKGYRVTRNSAVTVDTNGTAKAFKHGDHVTFSVNSGGKQAVSLTGIEFLGYGLPADYAGRDLKGKLVVTVPNLSPAAAGAGGRGGRGGGGGGGGTATTGAGAVITFVPAPAAPTAAEQALTQAQTALTQATAAVQQAQQSIRGGAAGGRGAGFGGAGGRGGAPPTPADLTSVQKVDGIVMPQFSGDETFFDALFDGKFAEIKARAEKGEPIAPMALAAKVTINIDNNFEVISQQLSHNVAGMIEGSDPVLKGTYVMFGSHLDHIGYSQTGTARGGDTSGCRRRSPEAQSAVLAAGKVVQRVTAPAGGPGGGGGAGGARGGNAPAANLIPLDERDVINNGADDDGSGSAAQMAVAKAFATGPKPKRSIIFVWHTGEEAGLYGSRYNADFPLVPLEKVQVQLNMDMIGRDDCDNIEGDFKNTVFVVGADRISTDLHNVIVQTNGTKASPLTLDYELNDAGDPEGVYTRSDHYSYAAKGIPIAFFTTGLHPDYHRNSDTVDKIVFPKMARIAQLVYETGFSIANTERLLERDNKGPQVGFGAKAAVIKKP